MMADNGFMASEIHKRNDLHTYLNDYPTEMPNLDKFYSRLVHIPCGWWVTLEDCDKILRVHAASISNHHIIELLNSYGYHCEPLP